MAQAIGLVLQNNPAIMEKAVNEAVQEAMKRVCENGVSRTEEGQAGPSGCPEAQATRNHRGPGANYELATSQVFSSIVDAEAHLAKYAGLEPGLKMVLNNSYQRKRIIYGTRRYRCPRARSAGWKRCSFTMLITTGSDGSRIWRQRKHPIHAKSGVVSKPKLSEVACEEVKKLAMAGCQPKSTFRYLRERGYLPAGLTRQNVMMKIYYLRQRAFKHNEGRPMPGGSLTEIAAFCRERQVVPCDDDESFCLHYVDDQDGEFFGFFTTRGLLKAGHSCPVLSADFTHKLSYSPLGVLLIGGIFPGNPPRFRLLLAGFSLHESQKSVTAAMNSLKTMMNNLRLSFSPTIFVGDAAPQLGGAFEEVHGRARPHGLVRVNGRLEWSPDNDFDGASTRLFCHVHMWRNVLQKGMPMLKETVVKGCTAPATDESSREEHRRSLSLSLDAIGSGQTYQKLRLRFKEAVTTLQVAPSPQHIVVCANLMEKEWSRVCKPLWDYFSAQWLEHKIGWCQTSHEPWADRVVPRNSNCVEAANSALKSGLIRENMALCALISELCATCSDYSFGCTHEAADLNDPLAPTKQQMVQAMRWSEGRCRDHIYISFEDDAYYVPSEACLRLHDGADPEELDSVVSGFRDKYLSEHESAWEDYSDYSRSMRQIRVVKRFSGDEGHDKYPRSRALQVCPSYKKRQRKLAEEFRGENSQPPHLPADQSSILRDVTDEDLDAQSSGDESDAMREHYKSLIEEVEAEVEDGDDDMNSNSEASSRDEQDPTPLQDGSEIGRIFEGGCLENTTNPDGTSEESVGEDSDSDASDREEYEGESDGKEYEGDEFDEASFDGEDGICDGGDEMKKAAV
ncbi:hypothetical protein Pmar_PMAR010306 [Perkinsus marinus ATCC 50983]|uniref:MULE transposase domain-containing protein n=1 Tax=Perkinsus marinus (strain ATCC 50983 / TXsc) TaxID=423536 RepID=C5K5D7_PERM5|nr:hypothetical protein Pmar_PMAR010306 [Perkinsus marinus ATCC 50983]EER20559.1 hypothetical protein Pmar_PMAR010306 [Perkinsus marinus ATCC 50983]|eukprot:XP_002788763.1 hypothetical protein Pmar_PMAR010306 [Perkinsus marinus ATCC 50983]